MALPILTLAYFALHIVAQHRSFVVFEVVMLATPFVGFVVGTGVVVAAAVRGRWRQLIPATGMAVVVLGVLLEVEHLNEWSSLFADHMNQWGKYLAPPRPCGVGVSMPFLIGGLYAIGHVPDQGWRYRRWSTALLLFGLGFTGLWVMGDGVLVDLAISGNGATSAVPALANGLFALAALTGCSRVFLSGFVDDRVPRATVWRMGR